jgi:hypothetical protein
MKKYLIQILENHSNIELHFTSDAPNRTIYTYAYKYAFSNNLFVLTYRVYRRVQIITLVTY